MMKHLVWQLAICVMLNIVWFGSTKAQDTLPNFTVKEISKEKIQISWLNPFDNCIQLAIQRSFDSTQFFKTIYSAQSPGLPQNGIIDNKIGGNTKVFYRVFYVLKGGMYSFTMAKAPDTLKKIISNPIIINEKNKEITNPSTEILIQNKASGLVRKLNINEAKAYKDSIAWKTKDTLKIISSNHWLIMPYTPKPVWKPSSYIFSDNDNRIIVKIPQSNTHNYKLVFYDDKGSTVFETDNIPNNNLTIHKGIFMHAGWFYFEIFKDGEMIERNKVWVESIW